MCMPLPHTALCHTCQVTILSQSSPPGAFRTVFSGRSCNKGFTHRRQSGQQKANGRDLGLTSPTQSVSQVVLLASLLASELLASELGTMTQAETPDLV